MRFLIRGVWLPLLVLFIIPSHAQEFTTTIFERTIVRAGPGHTYDAVIQLGAGTEVTVFERNYIGNWLYIQRDPLPGTETIEGWVKTGFLSLPEDLSFSDIPINDELPDGYTDGFIDEDIIRLYATPVIPDISDAMIEVYEHGQELGNHADVVTKVGDSNSASSVYLPSAEETDYILGPYNFLQDVVDTFGASFQQGSLAARVGMNAFSVFDPLWANQNECEENEAPLLCEYRVTMPAIALIMFGPNDLKALNSEQYREQMSLIVEESLELGIIPVLSTFTSNPEDDTWFQAVRFNVILLDVAEEYDIPIINLWSAARGLPRYGIGADNVHLTAAGASVDLDSGHESRYGISLQNLIVLHTLDRLSDKLHD